MFKMIFSKKGIVDFQDPKKLMSLIIGFILFALGLIPLLNVWNIISWNIPAFLLGFIFSIVNYLIAAIGFWLLIDGFLEDHSLRTLTLIAGILFIAFGLINVLSAFGIISFAIPFLDSYGLYIYKVIFLIEGILLMIASIEMI
jgi:hypothetical protein